MATLTGDASGQARAPMMVSLALDAVYFHSAKHFLEAMPAFEDGYARYRSEIEKGIRELEELEAKYADDEPGAGYDEMEPHCVKLDRDFESFEAEAYPYIRTVATVHLLSVACLEAHINIKAERSLTGYQFTEFDKLSLTGKWLFYPKLMSVEPFDPAREPFQSFKRLVGIRNVPVHYKERREGWRGYEVPQFIDSLGLTKAGAERSLQTAERMIRELSSLQQEPIPHWLAGRWVPVF
jgi:hypothetical protein